jgi:hypothetical protein
MPVKVAPAPRDGGVEVPTMEEFKALVGRVEATEAKLNATRHKSGHAILNSLEGAFGSYFLPVKLGWRPTRVDTNPHIRVAIQDDGFDLSSQDIAATDWNAYG